MPREPSKTFTDKELEIMRVLWDLGEATVKDLQQRLPGRRHYNSVLTIVRVLEQKGHVTHRVEGRAHIYRSRVSRSRAGRRVLEHLIKNVFAGSPAALVLHMVDTGDLTEADLRDIRARMLERTAKGDHG